MKKIFTIIFVLFSVLIFSEDYLDSHINFENSDMEKSSVSMTYIKKLSEENEADKKNSQLESNGFPQVAKENLPEDESSNLEIPEIKKVDGSDEIQPKLENQNSSKKSQKVKPENLDPTQHESEDLYNEYLLALITKNEGVELFGTKLFNNHSPSMSLPGEASVGKEYVLSSGDVITVNMWSNMVDTSMSGLKFSINKIGSIFIPRIGTVNVIGKSIEQLENEILEMAKESFKDLKVDISLLKMRKIKVFVFGEVKKPGVYELNPLSNVLNSIYAAGGITENSSLRNLKIIRGEKEIEIDLYPYLIGGSQEKSFKLNEGDTIFVPVAKNKLAITGKVIRPAIYELKDENSVSEIIELAGGMEKTADANNIQVELIQNGYRFVKNFNSVKGLEIKNEYISLNVGKISERIMNGVSIVGNVVNPGIYELKPGEHFSDLLNEAGGLLPDTYLTKAHISRYTDDTSRNMYEFSIIDENPPLKTEDIIYIYKNDDIGNKKYAKILGAVKNPGTYKMEDGSRISNLIFASKGIKSELDVYLKRADLYRISPDGRIEIIKINLEEVLAGNQKYNLVLEDNDTLKVYTYDEIMSYDNIDVFGEVRKPGSYRYYKNMTLQDLLFYSKGIRESGDPQNIEVARNRMDGNGLEIIKLDFEKDKDFILLADDNVYIRAKENYEKERVVEISGWVKHPGKYSIMKNETLNELLKRAGGFKEEAFPQGIEFRRKGNILEETLDFNLDSKVDESLTSNLELGKKGIKLTNITYNHEKGIYDTDIILDDGDSIYIPKITHQVKIIGEVYNPGFVLFDKKHNELDYYIKSVGGYKPKAYKKDVFVIKYNGKSQKNGFFKSIRVEPGDTIVVPQDTREKTLRDHIIDTTQILGNILMTIFLVKEIGD